MKIFQVSAYYPPHIGGMEYCVKEISQRLAERGHQVEVFTSSAGHKNEDLKINNNLKVSFMKCLEFAHTPIAPGLILKLFMIPRDSIIHLHIGQIFWPEMVYLVSKIRKIQYVAHVHADVEPSGKFGFLLPLYKKIFLSRVLISASSIIVPTEDYINIIINKYSIHKQKINVIPYGVNTNNFKIKSAKNKHIINILFVGRLSPQKNIPLLIESYKLIALKYPNKTRLNIVGDGEEKARLLSLIKRNKLEGNVILHGVLTGKKLYTVFSMADIFVLTSLYESFGIVLIEAMAAGLPIVASDIPGVRNVVQNNKTGLLVNLNTYDFVLAIDKLVKTKELRNRLSKNSLNNVAKYDWNSIVSSIDSLYKHI